MKLSQLKDQIDRILRDQPYAADNKVSIVLREISVGRISNTALKSVTIGFDWESGMCLLTPEEDLVRKDYKDESQNKATRRKN